MASRAVAALGSTNNFELPAEEVEKFAQDHSLNGGGAASNSTEDDDDDYTESLVYVSSPKVGMHRPHDSPIGSPSPSLASVQCFCASHQVLQELYFVVSAH